MKIIIRMAVIALALFVAHVPAHAQKKGKPYGKTFSAQKAMDVKGFLSAMQGKETLEDVVVMGEIAQVCQAEGCWMKLKNAGGEDVFVKFKDHSFVIPKDLAGHKVWVKGTGVSKVISVDEQRHYLEDEGASADQIAAVTEPKSELRIDATGIIVE